MLGNVKRYSRIYLAYGCTDLRFGIDGLARVVQDHFSLDPFQKGCLFLFCGRRTDRIKGLLWEGDGFVLVYKRLEAGRFQWPRTAQEAREITLEQFTWLMQGLAIEQKRNVNLNRQNMANWTIQCADRYLAILYDHLHKLLYQYHVLQADETPVEVTKDGRGAGSKSYMWIYRTGKSYAETIVLYEYQKDRKEDHPEEFLKGFEGVCVTDGCQAYHALEEKTPGLTIAENL